MTSTRTALNIVTIYPDTHTAMRVQWEVDIAMAGTGPFTFTLQRSGSPAGPWDIVATGLVDIYTYTDETPLLQGYNRELYYKVTATPGNLGSPPRNVTNGISRKKFLLVRKIINDERIMLKHGQGTDLYVVKQKHWGTRCKKCYDARSGHTIKKKCGDCYGTSFEQGYFTPIKVMGHIKPATRGIDLAADTSTPEIETTSAMIQAFPQVTRGDFLVEPDTNYRWEVTAVMPTQILRNTVHQDLTISRLPTAHTIYEVAIP